MNHDDDCPIKRAFDPDRIWASKWVRAMFKQMDEEDKMTDKKEGLAVVVATDAIATGHPIQDLTRSFIHESPRPNTNPPGPLKKGEGLRDPSLADALAVAYGIDDPGITDNNTFKVTNMGTIPQAPAFVPAFQVLPDKDGNYPIGEPIKWNTHYCQREPLHPIHTHEEHKTYMALASMLIALDPSPTTSLGLCLMDLTEAIVAWERIHYPFPAKTTSTDGTVKWIYASDIIKCSEKK